MMSEFFAPIIYEEGARIANVPENEAVLAQLAQAAPLSPEILFNTLEFFNAYPATQPLAPRIASFAYSLYVIEQRQASRSLKKERANVTPKDDEGLVDWLDGWDEAGQDEVSETPWRALLVAYKWISYNGSGLLVEVVKVDDEDNEATRLAYNVVGNINDPANIHVD